MEKRVPISLLFFFFFLVFLTRCLIDLLWSLLSIYNNTSSWLGEYSTTIFLNIQLKAYQQINKYKAYQQINKYQNRNLKYLFSS